jgi:hypothetical protein
MSIHGYDPLSPALSNPQLILLYSSYQHVVLQKKYIQPQSEHPIRGTCEPSSIKGIFRVSGSIFFFYLYIFFFTFLAIIDELDVIPLNQIVENE